MDMRHKEMTVEEILRDPDKCPLPLEVIPNSLGINLCAVWGVSWDRREDGQLVSLSIFFKPGEDK